ncbi:hypothetical protein Q7P37_005579 [Cladosporium fusiforme]
MSVYASQPTSTIFTTEPLLILPCLDSAIMVEIFTCTLMADSYAKVYSTWQQSLLPAPPPQSHGKDLEGHEESGLQKVPSTEESKPASQDFFIATFRQQPTMYSFALKALAAAGLPSVIAAPQGIPSVDASRSGGARAGFQDNASSSIQSPAVFDWSQGAVGAYEIHRSCNATQTALLRQAITETETLSAHARDHIQRFGNSSSYYKKYFGKAPTAEAAGWYDKLVNGDKAGVLFRCDDVDQNCATQDEWAGHWRGSNASDETVICDLSYTSRWYLNGICGYGYTVAGGALSSYFASDLIHRLFHTDKIGEGTVFHYADTYDECLALAIEAPEEAVRNAHTLQYFALDVYAYDIANPGQGCTGEPVVEDEEDASSSVTSSAASTSSTSSAEASSTTEPTSTLDAAESTTESATESAQSHCHTHDGGELHCV